MGLLESMLLGIALGVDALSVSLGLGVTLPSRRRVVQVSLLFAVASASLVAGGHLLARGIELALRALSNRIGDPFSLGALRPEELHDHLHFALSLLGAAILAGIGIHVLVALRRGETPWSLRKPLTVRGIGGLLVLAALVNIDALSAGLGLGMVNEVQTMEAALSVGVINGLMCVTGLGLGRRLDRHAEGHLHSLAGILLILVAIRLLLHAISA